MNAPVAFIKEVYKCQFVPFTRSRNSKVLTLRRKHGQIKDTLKAHMTFSHGYIKVLYFERYSLVRSSVNAFCLQPSLEWFVHPLCSTYTLAFACHKFSWLKAGSTPRSAVIFSTLKCCFLCCFAVSVGCDRGIKGIRYKEPCSYEGISTPPGPSPGSPCHVMKL